MQKYWIPDIPCGMITDDIGFVGGEPVSVHVLTSDEGLVLIDTGYPDMLPGIRENMEKLGLKLEDVRYIVHSHGHIDHFGTTAEISGVSGAKTVIGREDADIATGARPLSWAKELDLEPAETFVPDILISDGDVLELCGRRIRCIHAPGHTEGTYAFFIDTEVNGVPAVAAMHGGAGMNSMAKAFLEEYGLPLSLRDDFRKGLEKLRHEKVDVVLGNHPDQNDTAEKMSRLENGVNPFLCPEEWQALLNRFEKQLDDMLAAE